jgi:hypothetical protein
MRKIKFLFVFCSLIALFHGVVQAGTYSLKNGQEMTGDPISFDQNGVIFKADGKILERTPWAKFTQEALKQLREDAKTDRDKAFVEPLIEEDLQQKAKAKELNIKPVDHLERPKGSTGFFTLFSSPLGLFLILLVYGATIYAAYEVARFKGIAPALPCGLAAIPFLGFFSPIGFLFAQRKTRAEARAAHHAAAERAQHEATHYEPAATAEHYAEEAAPQVPNDPAVHTPAPAAQQPPPQPAQAAPTVVTFRRGEFTFNRRFFETKFAGFARAVIGEAEKDSVLYVKALRGEYIGRKISSLTQSDLVLQIFKGDATADESIPFSEISEVQIRPKDVA